MHFLKSIYRFIIAVTILTYTSVNGQIIFKNLPAKDLISNDSVFLNIGKTRKVLSLHGKWTVYPAESDKKEKVKVEIPSSFEGESELVFEKDFILTKPDIINHRLRLEFFGLNYSADISLNNISIHRHAGGEFPFSVDLPRDILNAEKSNILSIRLSNKSNAKTTIPVKQRFHFPKTGGGIFRDVFIHFTPNIFVSNLSTVVSFDAKTKKYFLNVKSKIENREYSVQADSAAEAESFSFILYLSPSSSQTVVKTAETKFRFAQNSETTLSQTLEIDPIMLWSTTSPKTYLLTAEIFRGENLIDITSKQIALYHIQLAGDSLLLNNQKFNFNGVTYYSTFEDYGGLITYSQMEKDILLIKATGFNAVRFAKKIPHPYLIYLCQNYGLMPLVELPINSVPPSILGSEDFLNRAINYTSGFLKGFSNQSIAFIGLGGGFVGNSIETVNLIKNLSDLIHKNSSAVVYASFSGPFQSINGLDLYGIELINTAIDKNSLEQVLSNTQVNLSRIFISEATHIASRGKSDGYLNNNSFEAQAKFFDDVVDFSNSVSLPGYFINSMFDYRSHFPSIISGFNKEHLLPLGLADEDRNTYRMGYKVIYAKLNKAEKVTIPIGSSKDDSPMLFIITGIIIAIFMGIMINSGKKFREDSSRALLRPYNFFADVRDQRLISGIHSLIMLVILSLTSGLLLSNILFFLKESMRFEKMMLSFGSADLLQSISMLAWNPFASIIWLSFITLLIFIVLMLIVKAASFFVKTRVAFSSVFHTVIWAFLPLVLLVPLGIILYKVLSVSETNIYLISGLFIFTVWVFYRFMKGIYVIFDTNPFNVYLYSTIILFIIAVVFVIYFQLSSAAFTYILHALKDYKFLG